MIYPSWLAAANYHAKKRTFNVNAGISSGFTYVPFLQVQTERGKSNDEYTQERKDRKIRKGYQGAR